MSRNSWRVLGVMPGAKEMLWRCGDGDEEEKGVER